MDTSIASIHLLLVYIYCLYCDFHFNLLFILYFSINGLVQVTTLHVHCVEIYSDEIKTQQQRKEQHKDILPQSTYENLTRRRRQKRYNSSKVIKRDKDCRRSKAVKFPAVGKSQEKQASMWCGD